MMADDSVSEGEHDTVKCHESSEHPQIPEFLAAVRSTAAKGWNEFASGSPNAARRSHFFGTGAGVGSPVRARSRR
jgi:hypothetical protein